jgi:hypothetical protein
MLTMAQANRTGGEGASELRGAQARQIRRRWWDVDAGGIGGIDDPVDWR